MSKRIRLIVKTIEGIQYLVDPLDNDRIFTIVTPDLIKHLGGEIADSTEFYVEEADASDADESSEWAEVIAALPTDEYYTLMGEYFGYPECCIYNFISRSSSEDWSMTPEQLQVIDGEGFVPCHAHAEQLIRSKLPLSSIIRDRVCTAPYPDSGKEMDIVNYLKNYVNNESKESTV